MSLPLEQKIRGKQDNACSLILAYGNPLVDTYAPSGGRTDDTASLNALGDE